MDERAEAQLRERGRPVRPQPAVLPRGAGRRRARVRRRGRVGPGGRGRRGTGKATVLFAARGLDIVAIEPSAEMAAVARRNCAGYENVTDRADRVRTVAPPGHEFRLVFSGQAWHWISPEVRYVAARAALADGGALAAFWNVPDWSACDLRDEIGEAYRRIGRGGDVGDPMNPSTPPRTRTGRPRSRARPASTRPRCAATDGTGTTRPLSICDLLGTHSAVPGARSARSRAAAVRHRRRDRRPRRQLPDDVRDAAVPGAGVMTDGIVRGEDGVRRCYWADSAPEYRATTTSSGASRSPTTSACSRSSASRDSRPGCRG